MARIEVNAPDLPGVTIEVGQSREYPYGPMLSHVLGYVAAVSERDLTGDVTGDPLLELPDFRIGKNGIEQTYDTVLRGSAGTRQLEVNSVGRVIRELTRNEGQPGRDLVLTLDGGLQKTRLRSRLTGQRSPRRPWCSTSPPATSSPWPRCRATTPTSSPRAFQSGDWKTLTRRRAEGR